MKPLVAFKRQVSTVMEPKPILQWVEKWEEDEEIGSWNVDNSQKFGHEEKERKVWVAGWKCVWLKQGMLFLGFMKVLEN